MKLADLHYRGKGLPSPLEPWMAFLLEIGALLGASRSEGRRLVIGVSVPTRAFAAVLAGTGSVLTRAKDVDPVQADAESYFEYLGSLPEGTGVSWYNGSSRRLGHLLGVRETPLGRRLMIQVSRTGDLREACTIEACLGVELLDDEVKLPWGISKRHPAAEGAPLLSKLLPGRALFPFASRTVLDCLIVGIASTLFEECSSKLGVYDHQSLYLDASINELLRVRVKGAKDTYRSVICGVSAKMMQVLATTDPGVVVFDGAQGYLRWRTNWPASPALLILDRSETHATEAAVALDQDRLLYGADPEGLDLPELPDGVEITSYMTRAGQ